MDFILCIKSFCVFSHYGDTMQPLCNSAQTSLALLLSSSMKSSQSQCPKRNFILTNQRRVTTNRVKMLHLNLLWFETFTAWHPLIFWRKIHIYTPFWIYTLSTKCSAALSMWPITHPRTFSSRRISAFEKETERRKKGDRNGAVLKASLGPEATH